MTGIIRSMKKHNYNSNRVWNPLTAPLDPVTNLPIPQPWWWNINFGLITVDDSGAVSRGAYDYFYEVDCVGTFNLYQVGQRCSFNESVDPLGTIHALNVALR